jgi:hypothetical protein
MRARPIAIVAATAATTIGGAMMIASKHRQFRRSTEADVRAVFSASENGVGRAELDARWDTLPVPIQRHLTYAITTAAPSVRIARLRHAGTFRTGPEQRWSPIAGEQYFSACVPGFVWFASMRVAPMVWIQARDRLVNGRGNMLIKLLSAFTIADASGPEIDQGAALRWLAESVWFPYAFAADTVSWEAIDARSARASLRTAGSPVQAIFEVDQDGRIVQLHAERFRDLGGGRSVLTPWSGRYSDYAEFGGFRVPSSVEVTWDLTDGPFSYARFNLTALEYNVPESF